MPLGFKRELLAVRLARPVSAARAMFAVLLLSTVAPLVAHSSQKSKVGRHHIDVTANKPAFVFGYKPGLNPKSGGQITIYGDGEVAMKTGTGAGSQALHLSKNGLNALLKLAEAENFFSMPGRIVPKVPVTDTSDAFITLHTTTQNKTVAKVVSAQNAPFAQLFAVLSAVAGSPQ